jgi:dolichol-phosphate mannosyltransferase
MDPTVSRVQRTLCVLPAFNEEGKIGTLVNRFAPGAVDEIVVVDDGSTDATASEAATAGATVITQPRNMGVGAAIRTGIDYALEHGFGIVVVMGGDDQDDPSEIPIVAGPVLAGEADFVQGSRRLEGRRTIDMPFFRRVTTKGYSVIFRLASGFPATDATNGFRAFRAEIARDPEIDLDQPRLNTYELEPYLLYKSIRGGYRVREAPVTKRYHLDLGYTKMRAGRDWWRILRPIIFLRLGLRS